MQYTVKYRNDFKGKYIGAKNESLLKAENIKSVSGAKWIWPVFYCRALMRGNFNSNKSCKATASFFCDNSFDLYVNGVPVANDVYEFNGEIDLLCGENAVAVRAYQTNSEDYYTSAFIGTIQWNDGKENVFATNEENWKWVHNQVFFTTPEPENWTTISNCLRPLLSCSIHPRLISRSMYFRKKFYLSENIKNAVINVRTLGDADIYINGQRINGEILGSGVMDDINEYRKTNITAFLRKGDNTMVAISSNAFLNSESHSSHLMKKPYFYALIEAILEDGTKREIFTDESWKTYFSPYTQNHLQYGERYDARLEIDGIFDTDFDDSAFFDVETKELEENGFALRNYEPATVVEKLLPVSERKEDSSYIFSYEKNCLGRYGIILKNTTSGQKIKISFAESLLPDGSFNEHLYLPVFYTEDVEKTKKAKANKRNYDIYICKGAEREVFEPHFSFSGLRYIRVDGLYDRSQLESIQLYVFRTKLERTGYIDTGYEPAKKIHDTSLHTFHSNLLNGAMDCPTREKNYWTGDLQAFAPTACYFENCNNLFARWSHKGRKMCKSQYGWGDEAYIVPYTLYKFYGNRNVLHECYDNMLDLFDGRYNENEILPENPNSPFNDHIMPGKDDVADNIDPKFFAHAFYCHMLESMGEISSILQKQSDSKKFYALFKNAKEEFIHRYYLPNEKDFTPHLQGGLVLPLAFGLVPDDDKKSIAATLNDYVMNRDRCVNTGFITSKFLLGILCDYCFSDAAFFLINNDKYPSWRHILSTGATNFTETWFGLESHLNASMNHFALGGIASWFYEYLGGIRWRESDPGFETAVLKPVFIREIGDFSVKFKTVNGNISTAWKYDGNNVLFNFETDMDCKLILPDGICRYFAKGKHSVIYTQ